MKTHSDSPARNLIGNGTVIKGDIESSGDIRVDGHVIGSIRSNGKIVVGQHGIIEGEMFCQNTDVSGKIKGTVKVEQLTALKSSSKVEGDLNTKQLFIEVGAVFIGKCDMSATSNKNETKK
ncbi:MAG: polymer-forming cytoskeletal protein [Lentimicrobiaceae bacterium]|jgi:cytoskeletal protein CcmA (bactofilin family)|nr:polymer-forming cytoskeletal protein [Lentimicrobiaceae bacterium]